MDKTSAYYRTYHLISDTHFSHIVMVPHASQQPCFRQNIDAFGSLWDEVFRGSLSECQDYVQYATDYDAQFSQGEFVRNHGAFEGDSVPTSRDSWKHYSRQHG